MASGLVYLMRNLLSTALLLILVLSMPGLEMMELLVYLLKFKKEKKKKSHDLLGLSFIGF